MGYNKLELGRDSLSTRWPEHHLKPDANSDTKIFVDREEGVGGDDHEPFCDGGCRRLI